MCVHDEALDKSTFTFTFTSPETIIIVLPDAEDRTIASSFVDKTPDVTGRRTFRQSARGYYSGVHCEQCGRAVKTDTDGMMFCLLPTLREDDTRQKR